MAQIGVPNQMPAARSSAGGWTVLERMPQEIEAGEPWIRAKTGAVLQIDRDAMAAILAKAPMEGTPQAAEPVVVIIPTPDGRLARFAAVESPVMERGLAVQFPEIKTYWARGIDDPHAVARFDLTPLGFHAQVLTPEDGWSGGHYMIDPYTRGDDRFYTSYYRRDYAPEREPFRCLTEDGQVAPGVGHGLSHGMLERSGAERRTYRIAVACTGEFGAFYGTQALAQAAIVTMVNRITGVYEVDLAVRLTLVANNNLVVYTNASTDPFTNTSSASATNTTLQSTLDSVIGNANYDIGHVVHNGANNGLAGGIGTVCTSATKGQGYTSVTPPTGDTLAIDYAAHEMGHQFGGRHTFNNCSGLGDSASYAFEPGSGVTIMGYAGICGTNNVAAHSDPDFHAGSIDLITAYTTTGGTGYSCAVKTATGNTAPSVTVSRRTYNIPNNTPFFLTATATDANGDALTYDWDEMDTSTTSNALPLSSTLTTGPMFRSWPATASPTRYFPRLADLVANTLSAGERLPTVGRTMNFRCLVRDNLGGVSDTFNSASSPTEIQVITSGTSGSFAVTSPNTAVTWSGTQTVTWNVAGTTASPISCTNVDILLSTDGGLTYPTTLLANAPNNGSASVTLPSITSSTARVMVRSVGNIFFDISDANFTVQPPPTGVVLSATGVNTLADNVGNGNNNTRIDPGESQIQIWVQARNTGLTTATGLVGTLSTTTPGVTITTPNAPYPNLGTNVSAINTTPYVVSVDSSVPCGSTINFGLALNATQGNTTYSFSLPVGLPGSSGALQEFNWTGATAIPDANTTGVTISVPVAGFVGPVNEVQFKFNGSSCTATAGATTVGLDHTWVGDLIVTLTAPGGSPSVVLMNRPGGGTTGSSGNNFCQTLLSASGSSGIQAITSTGAPYTGTFTPANPLSAFNGIAGNGTWTLKVVDAAASDTGTIRNFSIFLRGANTPATCQPPITTGCATDYNADTFVNLDDLSDYITDYYAVPPIPGGSQANAPTYPGQNIGFGVPCPGAPDAPSPYAVDAYRTNGYRCGYSVDNTNNCPFGGPNLDNLGDYITLYYSGGC
jgi:subtilisin-like proprotein convertase family protein